MGTITDPITITTIAIASINIATITITITIITMTVITITIMTISPEPNVHKYTPNWLKTHSRCHLKISVGNLLSPRAPSSTSSTTYQAAIVNTIDVRHREISLLWPH
jgi:hypothetical protein